MTFIDTFTHRMPAKIRQQKNLEKTYAAGAIDGIGVNVTEKAVFSFSFAKKSLAISQISLHSREGLAIPSTSKPYAALPARSYYLQYTVSYP